jgi:hypothetical protein
MAVKVFKKSISGNTFDPIDDVVNCGELVYIDLSWYIIETLQTHPIVASVTWHMDVSLTCGR